MTEGIMNKGNSGTEDLGLNEEATNSEMSSHNEGEDYIPKNWIGPDGNDLEGINPELIDGKELRRIESSAATSRILTNRLSGHESLVERARESKEPLPSMGGGKELPPYPGDVDPYIVTFDGDEDPMHPHNWPTLKKISFTLIVASSALAMSLGSAMYSPATTIVSAKFHVGLTTATLGTSLYVFGFASGPIIWGPMSELYGRKSILILSSFGFVCFDFAVATAENIQTIMICRFFAGFIGGAPLVAAPAAMADIFPAALRGLAMNLFASVVFGGPMLAPIFGGFTVKNSSLGWRWTSYFSAFCGCLPLILLIFFFEETHHPIILTKKAEILRRRTGNWGIHAPIEGQTLSITEIVENNLTRPIVMLITEPILFLITLYNAFIYGLLYLFLTAIPLIFQGRYGFSDGVAELPYLSMLIGILLGGGLSALLSRRYARIVMNNDGKPVPEEQLPPMMIGSFFFAGGLFWLGWSGDFPNKVPWIVPTIGASFIGFGLILIFFPCISYIVDCYLLFAASALAGNTLLRSIFGGVFPLFARQMFTGMKIKWGATLMGCVAAVLIPVPFLFYKYGRRIREKSKYAVVL